VTARGTGVANWQTKSRVITGGGLGDRSGDGARAQRARGAKVAVVDVRPTAAEQVAAKIRESGGVAEAFPANVADEEQTPGRRGAEPSIALEN